MIITKTPFRTIRHECQNGFCGGCFFSFDAYKFKLQNHIILKNSCKFINFMLKLYPYRNVHLTDRQEEKHF